MMFEHTVRWRTQIKQQQFIFASFLLGNKQNNEKQILEIRLAKMNVIS
jgi:hypothetical protein